MLDRVVQQRPVQVCVRCVAMQSGSQAALGLICSVIHRVRFYWVTYGYRTITSINQFYVLSIHREHAQHTLGACSAYIGSMQRHDLRLCSLLCTTQLCLPGQRSMERHSISFVMHSTAWSVTTRSQHLQPCVLNRPPQCLAYLSPVITIPQSQFRLLSLEQEAKVSTQELLVLRNRRAAKEREVAALQHKLRVMKG
jgi:hypothetical protein